MYQLIWTSTALETFRSLKAETTSHGKKAFKKLCKTLAHLQDDHSHPNLQISPYHSLQPLEIEVFEGLSLSSTSGHRVFWAFGPKGKDLTVLAIVLGV